MPVIEADKAVEGADRVIERYGTHRSNLIHVLQDIQEDFDYLPRPAVTRVSEKLRVPLSEVLRVATFYSAFSLEPRGEHLIAVCTGTACHVKGAPRIIDALRRTLRLKEGKQTTDDWKFTVKSVRCLGCCALAPVMNVDGRIYGRLTSARVPKILKEYE